MHEAARRDKLRKLVELGYDPWGGRFDNHQPIGQIRQREVEIQRVPAGDVSGQEIEQGPRVRAAGRIFLQRKAGKLVFLDLRDWTGRIQVLIGRRQVGEEYWALAECFDLGDIVGVEGELKHTNTGELTIFAERLVFLTKSLWPHPDKHHGLTDPELRQRLRYLDLLYTEGVWERFRRRTQIVHSIRQTMARNGFVEVEGPTLHAIAGGAAIARKAMEAVRMGQRTQLAEMVHNGKLTVADVMNAARHGDHLAQRITAEAGMHLGTAIANIVNLFNPSMVVIGGSVGQIGDLLLEPIRLTVQRRSLLVASRNVRITAALLGKHSVAIGAVVVALSIALHQIADKN